MRYPEFIAPGKRIGFIAPSFGCASEPYYSRFQAAIKNFQQMGYETVIGPNCYASEGIGKSSTPEKCAAEINRFFTSDCCDAVISCGGGETMCEDLPFTDFDSIAVSKPKWFMGYSDNTNLTFTLPVLTDTAAIYGPCAGSFAQYPRHKSLDDALGIISGQKLSVSNYPKWEKEEYNDAEYYSLSIPESIRHGYNCTEDFCMTVVNANLPGNGARFSGRLLGGCLDCLAPLCGTKFDKVREFNKKYSDDGIIWFLEACDLNPMRIRTSLWQLENAGWFENAGGFLIGRALQFDMEMMGMNRTNAVTGLLGKYNVPILMDVDIGHLPPMMPLISGAAAEIIAEGNSLSVNMKLI